MSSEFRNDLVTLLQLLQLAHNSLDDLERAIAKQNTLRLNQGGGGGHPSRPPLNLAALTAQTKLYKIIGSITGEKVTTKKTAKISCIKAMRNIKEIDPAELGEIIASLRNALLAVNATIDPASQEKEVKETIQENREKVRAYWATPIESAHLIQRYLNTPISADTIRKYVRQNKIRSHQGKVNIGDLLDTIPKLKYA